MKVDWAVLVRMIASVVIPATVPHGDLVAPLVIQGIQQAESMKGKTGAEKLKIATDLVDTGLAGINAAKPGAVDAAAVHAVVQQGISTVVDSANLIKNRHPQS